MSRIAISDELVTALTKMSEGNPGALTVLMQLVECTAEMDIQLGFAPFDSFTRLDSLEVYGPSIWILYKDICGENIKKLIHLLHGATNGILSEIDINKSIACHFPTERVKDYLLTYK